MTSPSRITLGDEWYSRFTPVNEDNRFSNPEEEFQKVRTKNGCGNSPLDSPVANKQSTPDPFGGARLNLSPDSSDEEMKGFAEI